MSEKQVSIDRYRALVEALQALADAGSEAIARLDAIEKREVKATNYATALRGFNYVANFIEATAGTAATEKSRGLIEPILEELKAVEADKSAHRKATSGRKNKD